MWYHRMLRSKRLIFTIMCLLIYCLSFLRTQEGTNTYKKPKLILYWTEFFTHKDFMFGFGRDPFKNAACKVDNCVTTMDKAVVENADAVVFHMRDLNERSPLPKSYTRSVDQRYIFLLMEHPYFQWNNLRQWEGFFNLTMTYRLDSDVPLRYGRSKPLTNGVVLHNAEETERRKTEKDERKLVAWFVSNCKTHSNREKYVKELQKHIQVDIFGSCGDHQCPDVEDASDKRQNPDCYRMLELNYKFYLAFENIYCKDYVTEKLYNILNHDVVPVVMGAANYTRVAPPKSVININDFASPKDLADHLIYLGDNPQEYWSYKEWRKTHVAVNGHRAWLEGFCRLCEVLNDPTFPRKVYHDLHTWWGQDTDCDLQATDRLLSGL